MAPRWLSAVAGPWSALLAGAALAAGCATAFHEPVRFLAADFPAVAPARAALLPFDNESVDLVAAEMVRSLAAERLGELGYDLVPAGRVDDALRGIGITDGGQLRAVAPEKAGGAVGADGLFYGVVEEFAFLNVGFAVRRVVRVRMKLVEARTGRTLWEDSGQGLTERWTLRKRDIGKAFMEGLLERAIEGLFKTPLQPEARRAVAELFWRLPPAAPRGGYAGSAG